MTDLLDTDDEPEEEEHIHTGRYEAREITVTVCKEDEEVEVPISPLTTDELSDHLDALRYACWECYSHD